MKTRTFLLSCFLATAGVLCTNVFGQTGVKYTYDAAGNRTARTKMIIMPRIAQTARGSETEALVPFEPEKFEETLAERNIVIYPNPTQGLLRIEISGGEIPAGARIYIYNATGTLVRSATGLSGSDTMDISAQPPGTYIMRIMLTDKDVSVWKIIKE